MHGTVLRKLSEEQIDAILADDRTHTDIAADYEVTPQHIGDFKNGKRRYHRR